MNAVVSESDEQKDGVLLTGVPVSDLEGALMSRHAVRPSSCRGERANDRMAAAPPLAWRRGRAT
jgi:hypothetical protein